MHAPTALLASLFLLVASWHAKSEEVKWDRMILRVGTTSTLGLIYPTGGKPSLTLSDDLHWGDPKRAGDRAYWLRTLNEQVLSKLGGQALQAPTGSVLLADKNAVEIYGLMTHPVKKGSYTGFEFLRQATSGLITLSEVVFGAQHMGKTIHLKEDVPSQKLDELMFFLCGQLRGNFWTLTPSVMTDKEGRVLPEGNRCLCPMVVHWVPASPP